MIKIKAVGGETGENVWDNKELSGISKIFVSDDGNWIRCIQFQYVEFFSRSVLSPAYGPYHGPKFYTITFDYPHEYLTRVTGKYTSNGLRSLLFFTNRSKYGPYGCHNDSSSLEFDFCAGKDAWFCGFHGTYDRRGLKSIGAHIKPL